MWLIHFYRFSLEKCGKIWKNRLFSGRIWPDWGNTAWTDMAGLGSIGLRVNGVAIPTNIYVTQIIMTKSM